MRGWAQADFVLGDAGDVRGGQGLDPDFGSHIRILHFTLSGAKEDPLGF